MNKFLLVAISSISLWGGSLLLPVNDSGISLASDLVAVSVKQSTSISRGNVGGIRYEVRGTGSTRVQSVNGATQIVSGRNTVRIRSGRVYLNGKDKGAIKAGDSVLLDASGRLYVNGKKK
jgi:hypothetical protein